MTYDDYMANVARLAVEIVNTASLTPFASSMLTGHGIEPPDDRDLEELRAVLRPAVAAICDRAALTPVNRLLAQYPPHLRVSDHDGPGTAHLHYAPDGESAASWLGRTCAAALAHIACGAPVVALDRCRAVGCGRFYLDRSRNRSRRFCRSTCASRTTVAAHRARVRGRSA